MEEEEQIERADDGAVGSLINIFAPEQMVPSQYFDQRRPRDGNEPIRRLMLAILEDAIRCWLGNRIVGAHMEAARFSRRSRQQAEAQAWIFADDERYIFSFINICGALRINPEYLRSLLRRARERGRFLPRREPVIADNPLKANRLHRHAGVIGTNGSQRTAAKAKPRGYDY